MRWFKKSTHAKNSNSSAPPPVKILSVSDYLSDKSITFFSQGVSREEILFKLVGSLPIPDHASALNAVLEREKMGGTIVDSAISIPHARLKGLTTIKMAVGICHDADPSKDQPRIFFLFLSPKEDTKIHLLFLSSLSSLFQTESFAEELLRLKAPHEVVQKIRQIEKGI